MAQISILDPLTRLAAIADAGSLAPYPAAGASTHVARWGIAPVADDGVVCARLVVGKTRVLAAAQDARFLGGSVGANHGAALHWLFDRALAERPDAVVLLVDSGGVRLHEANAAELALARALRALLDVRRAGIATVAIVTGAAFGGASVLAAACAHLYFLPDTRFGLSGPGVIETARGKAELDADNSLSVTALFGAAARVATGIGTLVGDDEGALRTTIAAAALQPARLDRSTLAIWDAKLAARLAAAGENPAASPAARPGMAIFAGAQAVDPLGWLWRVRDSDLHLLRPLAANALGPAEAVAIAKAIPHFLPPDAPLVIVEDSAGHATTRAAEVLGVSEYLAAHAARLALLQMDGHVVVGLLAGCGHSAAFFVNALQTCILDALAGARVEAMAPDAIARVTRLPVAALDALLEGDALMGQPVRHLAALGGIAQIHADMTPESLVTRVAEETRRSS
ncbi:MAG: biotin-independent malonate decarboxylase subunit gamma [Betaproteobacteria bacterium]